MNDFLRLFSLGIGTWFESWSFIFRNKLAHYFVFPVLLSVLLGAGAIVFIKNGIDLVLSLLNPYMEYTALPNGNWWTKSIEIFSNLGTYAIAFILWVISIYTFSKVNKYFILAFMSPVMALLSERTETILTGAKFPFDGAQLVRDVVRGVGLAIRNFFVEFFLTIVVLWGAELLITIFLPPLGVLLSPVFFLLSLLIGAYFFGFSTLDYYNERKRLSYKESVEYIRSKKGLAIGNGILFSLLFLIPVVGVTISTITCTVAATLAMHKENVRSSLSNK